jgi:hypothetical protein
LATNPEVGEILERTGSGEQYAVDDIHGLVGLLDRCLDAKLRGNELPLGRARGSKTEFEARETTRQLVEVLNSVAV